MCDNTAVQLERDAALREASLASAHDEVAALKDEARAAAATVQQQMLELSAYERQVGWRGNHCNTTYELKVLHD